tara:strand:- start:2500 stop:3003 length:504 start_codon:yes stop_codon:yes gene_type:complete
MNQLNKLSYVYDDGETLYLTDGTNYYGLNYNSIDKSELREYANIEPTEVEKDEDGELSYYYDDDSWEVSHEIIEEYIKDYLTSGCTIYGTGDCVAASQGAIFQVVKGDNGWYETVVNHLKKSSSPITDSSTQYDDGYDDDDDVYEDFVDERPDTKSDTGHVDDSWEY